MNTTPINMPPHRLCLGQSGWLAKPHVINGHEYATDGRICVRRPTTEPDTDPQDHGRHNFESPFSRVGGEKITLGDVPQTALTGCGECKGVGFLREVACPSCLGDGEAECPCCGHYADCDECDGIGTIHDPNAQPSPCPRCGTTGLQCEGNSAVRILDRTLISYMYYGYLRHKGVREVQIIEPEKMIGFNVGEYEGRLACVDPSFCGTPIDMTK